MSVTGADLLIDWLFQLNVVWFQFVNVKIRCFSFVVSDSEQIIVKFWIL